MQQGRCANYDGDHVMFTAGYNKGYDTYIWNGSGHTLGNGFSRTAEPDFDHYDGGLMGYEIDGKKGKDSIYYRVHSLVRGDSMISVNF